MRSFDIVIVGAGPAGMSAAIAAGNKACSIAVIDDNPSPGGQIWRSSRPFREFADSGAETILGARVVDASATQKRLVVEAGGEVFPVAYSKLILATGAREIFLPFPGCTMPNVFGVGGLQALAKSGLSVERKRIVIAGSGPLLLAVAAYLKRRGAEIPLIAEQASWSNLLRFGTALLRHPSKVGQAVRIKTSILRTKYLANCWVTAAAGNQRLQEVTLTHKGKTIQEGCDYLAVSYGFAPNTELAQLLNCNVSADGFVTVDENQRTSVDSIYCAGEPTGLGGLDKSLLDGRTAGGVASGTDVKARRNRIDHFTGALARAFTPRPELRSAVTPESIVCRCEDVCYQRLQQAANWREAKLHLRCGMGPCQGRVCGPAVHYLFGWKHESIRPPIFPATVRNLINTQETIQS